ncbi:TPA: hypothetical protein ACGW3M_000996 [Pseudomonas aeruginosa]|uniref:hypothetical protein n=1 Tax=Pseudomonas aeruginosa TaxID=287 RepID=UPI0027FDC402|nr:hypothetical protein [Pseudomonas aeruginosa]EKY4113664.1 hypothetical protein [Pseudomonas aeruginosa]ELJ2276186.1 hypothetical protein [Pseudomonas aeruginosa]MCS8413389.1 hypothetical protein [Pseudomonas aeruginosa]MCS9764320.1 hypothetical protein [Pseudomonas aeruginosa]
MEAVSNTAREHVALSPADIEALAELPATGWFGVAHLPINRPGYRCERLEQAGCLVTRVVGVYPFFSREYRVIPEAVTAAALKARSVKLSAGEAALLDTIIEHYYPEPQAGTFYYVEPQELRAARGLCQKLLATLEQGDDGAKLTFTSLGADLFFAYKAQRGSLK